MSLINNIFGFSASEINRSGNSGEAKKTGVDPASKENKRDSIVRTEISGEAKEMLALQKQADAYVQVVKSAETIRSEEVEQIQHRVQSDFYFEPEVIDKVVEKILYSAIRR